MRTRTRLAALSTPQDSLVNLYDDVGQSNYGLIKSGTTAAAQSFSSPDGNIETITDQQPRWVTFGSAAHTRNRLILYPSSKTERITRINGDHELLIRGPWFLVNQFHSQIRFIPSPSIQSDQWGAWSREAMEYMMPTFHEGGESLVNALLEIKQLSSLFKLWSSRISKLRNAANAHLAISFGWLPFVSDAQRIWNSLRTFRRKLARLQRDAGKVSRHHYMRPVDTATLVTTPGILYQDAVTTVSYQTEWIDRPVYRATADIIYVLPDMSSVSNQIKAFLDHLGVQLDAGIVWNAIPYSFLVDWFVDVGGWVGSLRTDNLKIPATVVDFCHSIKWSYRTRYTLVGKPTATNLGDKLVMLADREVLRYERRRDIPSWGTFDYTVQAPDWGKLALGASLTVQNGKRFKRWLNAARDRRPR